MKNYIGFVNDHSGSMCNITRAAINDYNANITATKDAATAEMLDTVVSVVGIGGFGVERQVTVSNPHVLKPLTTWKAAGGTPLYEGIINLVQMHDTLPDINKPDVSVLLIVTTDGAATDGHLSQQLRSVIAQKMTTNRWTFVFRVPKGQRHLVQGLGVPEANIQEWETSSEGMARSSAQTQAAMTSFYSARSAGATSSSVFYSSAQNIDTKSLVDISKETSLYICGEKPEDFDGIQIKDFILARRQQYLVGAAFYQLVKTEARVQPSKLILIREKNTGKVYAGTEARKMIGLDTVNNARLHPNHGGTNYDIFIQSESVNRKIGKGHGVLYWAVKGRPMTEADLNKYANQAAPAPAVPKLAEAPATGRPTPSTIPVTPKPKPDLNYVNGKKVYASFATREAARNFGRSGNVVRYVQDIRDFPGNALPGGVRWFLFE